MPINKYSLTVFTSLVDRYKKKCRQKHNGTRTKTVSQHCSRDITKLKHLTQTSRTQASQQGHHQPEASQQRHCEVKASCHPHRDIRGSRILASHGPQSPWRSSLLTIEYSLQGSTPFRPSGVTELQTGTEAQYTNTMSASLRERISLHLPFSCTVNHAAAEEPRGCDCTR